MWSKTVVVLLLVALESRLISGQYFRKGYKYIASQESFYKINTLAKTWSQANIRCLHEGATLFFPENESEANAVIDIWNATQPNSDAIYIGISNWNVDDTYDTVDGRDASDVYVNWAYGEPNGNSAEHSCVTMQKNGTFKDGACGNKYPYICKKTLATLQWNSDCNLPDLDYKYNETLNRCYKFHLYPQNWTDAYSICDAEESYLVIINSEEEDQHLINITASADKDSVGGNYLRGAVHAGFNDNNGIWETIKGVPLEESGFGNGWADSQPDGGGNETCGSMFYTGELNDIGCWQRMFFICEHEIQTLTVVNGTNDNSTLDEDN